MTRALPAGSLHDMLGEALDAAGRKRLAEALSVSAATLSRHADPDEENGRPMSAPRLDLMCRLFPAAAAVVARHFARMAGGAFVPGGGVRASISATCADLNNATARATAALLGALDPEGNGGSAITRAEAWHLDAALQDAIEAGRAAQATLAAQLQGGGAA